MFTARVKMSEFKVEFRAAHNGVGINSSTGSVILQSRCDPLLHKFLLHQDGSYSNEWRRHSPENKLWERSFLTDAGDVILQDQDDRTCLFGQDMQLIDSWQYMGYLIAYLPGPRTVYMVRKGEHYVVDIRSQDGETLRLKSQKSEHDHLSVCKDVITGKIVALDNLTSSIDIFSQDGKSQRIINIFFRIQSTDKPVSSLLAFISVAEDEQASFVKARLSYLCEDPRILVLQQ